VYVSARAAELAVELADLGLGAAAQVSALALAELQQALAAVANGGAAVTGSGDRTEVVVTPADPNAAFIRIIQRLKDENPGEAAAIDAIVRRRFPALREAGAEDPS
jgi:hypothetical protein